jgi:galactonate dehydratase
MKITDVKTYRIKGYHERLNWVLVQVETDEGVVGLGDATNWPHSEIIEKAIQCQKEHVIGESPFDIEHIWKKLYNALVPMGYGGVQVSAIAGIETACWDIIGKVANLPVYNLIGGRVRDRLRLFAICGDGGPKGRGLTERERVTRSAQRALDMGYTAFKYSPKGRELTWKYIREAGELGLAIRDVLGEDNDISVDLGNVTDVDTSIRFANSVAQCDPIYMELHSDKNIDTLVKIKRYVPAPLCIGEHQWARYGFREAFEKQACEVINLDVARTGGISEARKIAAMAEAYHIRVAPHNPNGPVSTLISGQAAIGMPNFIMLEFIADDVPWRDDIIDPPLRVEDGHLILPDKPGIGAELVRKEVVKHLAD